MEFYWAASLWARYLSALQTAPFITKGLTGGCIKFGATLASQRIRNVTTTDWKQVRQYVCFAMFFDTPICQPWYNMGGLALLTRITGVGSIMTAAPAIGVIFQAALDQLTFGIIYNCTFYVVHGLIGGKSLAGSVDTMKKAIIPCTKASCGYWIPATGLALSMPSDLVILTMNISGFFWTVLQSLLTKKIEEAEAAKRAKGKWHMLGSVFMMAGSTPHPTTPRHGSDSEDNVESGTRAGHNWRVAHHALLFLPGVPGPHDCHTT
mmetsp:Transcript_26004/g.31559  ORF Transcript_26004/g.31559 Transcript_26004/m.31559 type:complete len:264 (+) Transcript_26004:350-1141(+)